MNVEYHRHYSQALGHEMEFKVYGERGQPIVVFPAQHGRFYDYENFGMVEAARPFLESGQIQLYTVDSIDWQSWTNQSLPPALRARRHSDYDRYIMEEFFPFLREHSGSEIAWATGCSMGAFHSANFFFRHPDHFDGLLALSGRYQVGGFTGDEGGMDAYYNSPLWYLKNMDDPWYLERYRRAKIVFAVGQGRWEGECIRDTREMEQILRAKGIPAWVDYWGYDVDHDWPWWRKMLPYFLGKMLHGWGPP